MSAVAHLIVLITSAGQEPSFNMDKGLTSSKKTHEQSVIKQKKKYIWTVFPLLPLKFESTEKVGLVLSP